MAVLLGNRASSLVLMLARMKLVAILCRAYFGSRFPGNLLAREPIERLVAVDADHPVAWARCGSWVEVSPWVSA
jgi:hypothetical protein